MLSILITIAVCCMLTLVLFVAIYTAPGMPKQLAEAAGEAARAQQAFVMPLVSQEVDILQAIAGDLRERGHQIIYKPNLVQVGDSDFRLPGIVWIHNTTHRFFPNVLKYQIACFYQPTTDASLLIVHTHGAYKTYTSKIDLTDPNSSDDIDTAITKARRNVIRRLFGWINNTAIPFAAIQAIKAQ